MDWLNGVFALGGVALAIAVEELRRWRERRERFRDMTFEKRLQAHQEAYYWVIRLGKPYESGDWSDMKSVADKAAEWFSQHCLYLDTHSHNAFSSLLSILYDYIESPQNKDMAQAALEAHIETIKAIVKGIGLQYLPPKSELPTELLMGEIVDAVSGRPIRKTPRA